MALFGETLEVADQLYRAEKDGEAGRVRQHWDRRGVVRLTNFGDGTAHDVRVSGSDCRPRVWLADMGIAQLNTRIDDDGKTHQEPIPPIVGWPMWSDKLAALKPGESVDVIVMSSPDESRPKPVLEASWAGPLSNRRFSRRRTRRYDLATARAIEVGWPGKRDIAGD